MKVLFDTNILLDCINGHPEPRAVFTRFTDAAISIVSWAEVLAGESELRAQNQLRMFMQRWPVLMVDFAAAESAAAYRRKTKVRMADALIWGVARANDRILVTRNTRDFDEASPQVFVPYRLN